MQLFTSLEICVIVIAIQLMSKVIEMILFVYGILLLVYLGCPKYLKAAAMLLNLLVSDPVPYIDEIIMLAGLLKSE